ncbi:Uncharacterised protein [Mycobacteroides abscessus subsp. abscessus]|nr:Uncharacterised protein [Mycobacteroides abscessus subsp. abscessus]
MVSATLLIRKIVSLAIRYPGAALAPKTTVRGVTSAGSRSPEMICS